MAYVGKGEIPATHPLGNNQISFVKRPAPPPAEAPREGGGGREDADPVQADDQAPRKTATGA